MFFIHHLSQANKDVRHVLKADGPGSGAELHLAL